MRGIMRILFNHEAVWNKRNVRYAIPPRLQIVLFNHGFFCYWDPISLWLAFESFIYALCEVLSRPYLLLLLLFIKITPACSLFLSLLKTLNSNSVSIHTLLWLPAHWYAMLLPSDGRDRDAAHLSPLYPSTHCYEMDMER